MLTVKLAASIPAQLKRSLDDYAERGIPTGSCMRHVLANRLREAFLAADPITTAAMASIVAYVYHCLPVGCHGSEAAVDEWIRAKQVARAEARKAAAS